MAKLNCHADLEADSDLSWLQHEMHSLMAENLFGNAAEDNSFGALLGLPGGMPGNLNLLSVNGADIFAQRDVNMNMGGDVNVCSDNLTGWSGIGAASAFGLPTLPSDPAFVERAAKYSSFAKGNGSNPSKAEESAPSTATSGTSKDGPSDFAVSGKDAKSAVKNKRKTLPSSKAVNSETANGKRCKGVDSAKDNGQDSKSKAEQSKQSKDNCAESAQKKTEDDEDSKAPAPPEKPNYIHVRARRGQATDSHSLAERVRREKISERMKLLQDLVPGCSKITGKALMLDEIINHVQSLQRQVEFLSMKLATVNPRLDFDMDHFIAKEMMKPCPRPPSNGGTTPELTASSPYLQYQKPSLIQAVAERTFTDVSAAWDAQAQFHNMFNLGFQPGRTQPAFESQAIPGNFSLNHAMKREL